MFAERLKSARVSKKMKQSELGAYLGVSGNTISNWEKGVSKPDINMVEIMCRVLNVSPTFFFDYQSTDTQLNLHEQCLIKKYRRLNENNRQAVDVTIDTMLAAQDNAAEKKEIV